jgi:membrane associated rhomboid family serine protease
LTDNFNEEQRFAPEKREPIFNVPLVVVVLLGSFVAVHVVREFMNVALDYATMLYFAFSPARYMAPAELPGMTFPGGFPAKIWTFFTHMFLHGDWLHLIINSVWMLAFGTVVARRFGALRFLAFTLVTAAFGAAANLYWNWGQFVLLIGASGAISGHMAGAVRLMFSAYGRFSVFQTEEMSDVRVLPLNLLVQHRQALIFIVIWLGANLIFGVSGFGTGDGVGRIAWEAHMGGFISGLVLFALFDRGKG